MKLSLSHIAQAVYQDLKSKKPILPKELRDAMSYAMTRFFVVVTIDLLVSSIMSINLSSSEGKTANHYEWLGPSSTVW